MPTTLEDIYQRCPEVDDCRALCCAGKGSGFKPWVVNAQVPMRLPNGVCLWLSVLLAGLKDSSSEGGANAQQ